jgi:hypothetical protein
MFFRWISRWSCFFLISYVDISDNWWIIVFASTFKELVCIYTAELEPVRSGRFKKCFKPVKTGRYSQAIYRCIKKVVPKNTRLRIFCRVFVSIDFCNNISWTCTCTRHNLLRKKSISRNLWSSFLTKAWGGPRGSLLN